MMVFISEVHMAVTMPVKIIRGTGDFKSVKNTSFKVFPISNKVELGYTRTSTKANTNMMSSFLLKLNFENFIIGEKSTDMTLSNLFVFIIVISLYKKLID